MGELELPPHWKVVKLGELCKIVRGASPRPKSDPRYYGGTIPRLMIADVTRDGSYTTPKIDFLTEEGAKLSRPMKKGDLILSISGTVGLPCFLAVDACIHDGFIGLNNISEILNKEYLYFQLLFWREKFNIIAPMGSIFKNLTTDIVKQFPIYLPPLSEQKTIAHTLRTIQKAKETRQRELELERERKAALMQYLFTHGTRNEQRKQTNIGKIPETWEVVTVDKVCEFLQYGTSKLCDSDTSGIPVLRIPNVIGGKINIFDLKFTKPEKKEFEKLSLEAGDLLFVRTNGRKEYIGRCAVFCGKPPHAMFASYLIRVRLKVNILLPEFFQFYTMTHRGKSYLSGRASNAADGKFNINTQTIKAVLVPIPSIDEQHEIIGTLQACDRKIQALEKELTLIDELFHAMLEQLMTGKISTQPLTEIYV
ncbi:restriction endonuclease subunit S [Nostoc sp. 'Peltigera membranacea cyanobiont' 232]|uniref:restriction endonuclease subunit S n=1 Tax=Nostoc sp. 'Peltigera membranacea cyanobiont' 232 TaxID=2014531 RepID=UPI00167846F3|nr:restriction endonuclease subunit S [Nostoc sp. 'Peltigera membranacea cyanobiont' 232]